MTAIADLSEETLLAFGLALSVEQSWAESSRITGSDDWPIGYCVEASICLYGELKEKVPGCDPVYVWGEFMAGVEPIAPLGHAWIEVGGGTILDITAAQFFRAEEDVPSVMLVPPERPLAARYKAKERDPTWAVDW